MTGKSRKKTPARTVRIVCTGAETRELAELHPFQRDLKVLTRYAFGKLRDEILTLGFCDPFNVWVCPDDGLTYILDGHQRLRVLQTLAEDGYAIPPLPVNTVEATNKRDAKLKLLSLSTEHGTMTEEGLHDFVVDAGIELDEIALFNFSGIDVEEFVVAYGPEAAEAFGDFDPDTLVAEGTTRFVCGEKLRGSVSADDANRLAEIIQQCDGELLVEKLAAFLERFDAK